MAEKNKTMLVSTSEARERVRQRLMGDWVAVIGTGDAIYHMECTLYPPGTPKNADFEAVGILPPVYLAKKTDELQRFCSIPDFDELMVIIFHAPVDPTGGKGIGWLAKLVIYDKAHGDKVAAMDLLVSKLTQHWDGPHEDQGANNG